MRNFSLQQKFLAWSVHVFTSLGIVAGFMAILAINESDWKEAMIWLMVCQFIDGVDGTFARLFKVKEVLPYMDGTLIDNVIDFATYAIIPAYFFYSAGLVEESWQFPLTALILVVSAVYYGKEGMISEDKYFIGFPVMWNMVVFYLVFVFAFPFWANALAILFFSIMHFIPIKFAYPSRMSRFKYLTIGITLIYLLVMVLILYYFPERQLWLTILAIAVALYFGAQAVWETWLRE
ncbi:MAG: phosphatidylcholine/phosphatidylserine synthase [Bacteroidetes bacterium]|nr:phosphatidylcholine/phosphatidylserine synthase [Bacteroidota bacterium]